MQLADFALDHLLSLTAVRILLKHAHHDSLKQLVLVVHPLALLGARLLVRLELRDLLRVVGHLLLQLADFHLERGVLLIGGDKRLLRVGDLLAQRRQLRVTRVARLVSEDLLLQLAEFFQEVRIVRHELVRALVQLAQADEFLALVIALLCERSDLALQIFLALLRLQRLAGAGLRLGLELRLKRLHLGDGSGGFRLVLRERGDLRLQTLLALLRLLRLLHGRLLFRLKFRL